LTRLVPRIIHRAVRTRNVIDLDWVEFNNAVGLVKRRRTVMLRATAWLRYLPCAGRCAILLADAE
jgi:hypothetical protein